MCVVLWLFALLVLLADCWFLPVHVAVHHHDLLLHVLVHHHHDACPCACAPPWYPSPRACAPPSRCLSMCLCTTMISFPTCLCTTITLLVPVRVARSARDYCIAHLPDTIAAFPTLSSGPGDAMRAAFVAVDAGFRSTAAAGLAPLDGVCVVCLLVQGCHVTVAHVGDCRAVLLRADGALVTAVTKDHKPLVPTEVARLRSTAGDVGYHRVKDVFTYSRSIGDAGHHTLITALPDVAEWDLDGSESMVIMASDGACVLP